MWRGARSNQRQRLLFATTGLGLLYRGLTGRCPGYRAAGRSTAKHLSLPERYELKRSIAINLPARELLNRTRLNMRRLLDTTQPVAISNDQGGSGFMWECANERGSIRVTPFPDTSLSLMEVRLDVTSGSGLFDKSRLKVERPLVKFALTESLRRFKAWAESGEAPVTTGQPHGQRSMLGATLLGALAARRSGIPGAREMYP